MSKKVLIISTSIRPNSNSELLANAFADGARKSGNEVELVSLIDKTIGFCKGCLACQKLGRCVVKDDANEITEKLLNAEVVVWVTPIYYYEMSGQMSRIKASNYKNKYKQRTVCVALRRRNYNASRTAVPMAADMIDTVEEVAQLAVNSQQEGEFHSDLSYFEDDFQPSVLDKTLLADMLNSRPEFKSAEYADSELKAVISDEYLVESIGEESGISM